jgi:hypothetical protein
MYFLERIFVALAVTGFLGLVATVIWWMILDF